MKRSTPLQQSLRALLGLVVIVLQVLGALHFTLVRHGYSATLGGVVHVHAARAEQKLPNRVAPRIATLVANLPACSAELCPEGNAPQSSAPQFELLATGFVAFGEARLLSERAASSSKSLRVFSSAPKTSPPA